MKKTLLLVTCLCASISSFAQLKVKYDGTTIAGTDNFQSSYHVQLGASSSQTTGYNIGVAGNSEITTPAGIQAGVSCGVHGRAKNQNCGMTYGVAGDLHSSCTSGAGVIGSTAGIIGYIVPGKYAGYFYGNTYVNGTLTATQVLQSSDRRLKDNIMPLSDMRNSTLDKLLDINIVSFNYSPKMFVQNVPDSVSEEDAIKNLGIDSEKKHFGVIAQELQSLFPELVEEGQDGYLKVNYVELIPLLIRGIQELKEELNELKGLKDANKSMSSGEFSLRSETSGKSNQKQTRYSLNVDGQTIGVKRTSRNNRYDYEK